MGWSKVWKVLSLKYSTVEQLSPFFSRNCWNHLVQHGEIFFHPCQQEIGRQIKQKKKKTNKKHPNCFKPGCQHSASSPLRSVPSHLFLWLFAREEISVSEMLLFFFMALWCSPFRGCWDALFILGAFEFMCCFQMLRNRQGSMMNRQRQPRCQSKS